MKYPKELAGIRGLAATYVLLRHCLADLPRSAVGDLLDNNYGVKLFMIVSGFSIYWLLDTRRPPYGRFVVGRIFRIFPVYLVGVVLYTLMLDFIRQTFVDAPVAPFTAIRLELVEAAQSNLAAHVLAHVTLLHGLVPQTVLPRTDYTLLAQAWSLTVEWQLYIVAPLIVACLATLDRGRSQMILVGLLGALLWVGHFLSVGFLGNNLAMFAIGFLSYALVKSIPSGRDDGALRVGLAAILVLVAACDTSTLPSLAVWIVTLFAAVTVDRCAIAATVSRALASRGVLYLGRISYSFYIFHTMAMFLCLRSIDRLGVPSGWRYLLLPLTAFALTILFAEIAHRFVEQPFNRLGKRLGEARPRRAVDLAPHLGTAGLALQT